MEEYLFHCTGKFEIRNKFKDFVLQNSYFKALIHFWNINSDICDCSAYVSYVIQPIRAQIDFNPPITDSRIFYVIKRSRSIKYYVFQLCYGHYCFFLLLKSIHICNSFLIRTVKYIAFFKFQCRFILVMVTGGFESHFIWAPMICFMILYPNFSINSLNCTICYPCLFFK